MATTADKGERADADTGRPAPDTAPDDEVGVTDLRARDYLSILKRAAREAVDDQIPDSAAAIAYYAFLAIPALLLVSVGVFSLVASPSAIETIIDKLGSVIPAEAATLLEDALNRTAEGGGGLTMILVGGAVAVWTASGVANALMRALNRVYDTDESRGFLRQRLVGLVMVAVGVAAFVLVFGLLVLGPKLSGWVGSLVGAEGAVRWAWLLGEWPILLVGLLVAFGAVLFFGPNVEHPRWSFLSVGAGLAVGALAARLRRLRDLPGVLRLLQQDVGVARRGDHHAHLALAELAGAALRGGGRRGGGADAQSRRTRRLSRAQTNAQHAVERPRHAREVERLDEQRGVADLPAAAAPEEPAQLLLDRPSPPRRLLLQRPERAEVALRLDELLHPRRAERPDQLVLEVALADEEPEARQVGASARRAEPDARERSLHRVLLPDVVEAGQPQIEPRRAVPAQVPADRVRSADRHDGDALGGEVAAAARGECLERASVALALDEDDRTRVDRQRRRRYGCLRASRARRLVTRLVGMSTSAGSGSGDCLVPGARVPEVDVQALDLLDQQDDRPPCRPDLVALVGLEAVPPAAQRVQLLGVEAHARTLPPDEPRGDSPPIGAARVLATLGRWRTPMPRSR